MKEQLKPCDCRDAVDADLLNEQGIGINDHKILLQPNVVIITMDHTNIKIPMKTFKMFAEWYLEPQEVG